MFSFSKRVASLRLVIGFMAGLAVVTGALVVAPAAYAGVDDYPAKWKKLPKDATFDNWGEYTRECTSFVAFRLHTRNLFEMPFHDNADGWGPDAKKLGYTVNKTPAVGAVAWWSSMHVAWVEAVNLDGTITIEEYNIGGKGKYSERTIPANHPTGYIHFRDLAVDTSDGAYLAHNGNVYRVAGHAPLYVTTVAKFGKKKVGVATSKIWNSLTRYPKDGSYITGSPSGSIYRIVGGAPILIKSWASVGGKQPSVAIRDTTIVQAPVTTPTSISPLNHLRYYPANGKYVVASPSQKIYKITDGAADPVVDWASVGGEKPAVQVTDTAIAKAGAKSSSGYSHLRGQFAAPVPKVKGLAKVGHTLTVSVATWKPATTAHSISWLRNGVPIHGAHGTTYKLTAKDHHTLITAVVTGSRTGFRTLAAPSLPHRVVGTK